MVWPKSHTPFRKSELMLVLKKCWTFCLQTWWRIIYKLDCKEFQIIWNGKKFGSAGYTFIDGPHFLHLHPWRGQIRYISLLGSSLIIFELFSLKLLNYTHWSMISPGMWMYFLTFPAWTKLLKVQSRQTDRQKDRKKERQKDKQADRQNGRENTANRVG